MNVVLIEKLCFIVFISLAVSGCSTDHRIQAAEVRVPATEIEEFDGESLGCAFVFLVRANDDFTRLLVVDVDSKKLKQKYGEFEFDIAVSDYAEVRVEEFTKSISKNPRYGYCAEFPRGRPVKIYRARTGVLKLSLEERMNSEQLYASASMKNVRLESKDGSELLIKKADIQRKVVG